MWQILWEGAGISLKLMGLLLLWIVIQGQVLPGLRHWGQDALTTWRHYSGLRSVRRIRSDAEARQARANEAIGRGKERMSGAAAVHEHQRRSAS